MVCLVLVCGVCVAGRWCLGQYWPGKLRSTRYTPQSKPMYVCMYVSMFCFPDPRPLNQRLCRRAGQFAGDYTASYHYPASYHYTDSSAVIYSSTPNCPRHLRWHCRSHSVALTAHLMSNCSSACISCATLGVSSCRSLGLMCQLMSHSCGSSCRTLPLYARLVL